MIRIIFFLGLTIGSFVGKAQLSSNIRLNQVGFYPSCTKMAVIAGNPSSGSFSIRSTNLATTYFTGTLSNSATWTYSGETVRVADFSAFTTPGNYVLTYAGGNSYPFSIGNKMFYPVTAAGIKSYYYNRGSTAITAAHGGVYARAAGHMDNNVIILPSAASAARPAGTVLASPKGWYDAGDYNSYIVNSGISTYTLLATYEHFKPYFDTLNLNIPESGNGVPDLLDEIRWNLDWMLTMQDPNDGGVYNKKTNANFDGYIMPAAANAPRYFCAKGTAAAFDFAAVMAVANRIYKNYDVAFANQCLAAAQSAYNWGLANPNIAFNNPGAQGGYPAVVTGGYGDGNFTDEREWAATELYLATGTGAYYANSFNNATNYGNPYWGDVRTLGLISLVFNRKNLTAAAFPDTTNMKNKILNMAIGLRDHQNLVSAYRVAMGQGGVGDFVWGSNSVTANQGMLLLNAYEITKDVSYWTAALANLDYLLGRNATNYSFVTGYGDLTPMRPHHRLSEADGIVNPIPGMLVGGPQNNSTPDGCPYAYNNPATRYIDAMCSYSTNEIAINWTAPFVFLSAGIEYLRPCGGTLPLTFQYFGGESLGEVNRLQWSVADEQNTSTFYVQRSEDGVNFHTVGTIAASNKPGTNVYHFEDHNAPHQSWYYRIMEKDLDGSVYYSSTLALEASIAEMGRLYPNPNSGGSLTLEWFEGTKHFELRNALGQIVIEKALMEGDNTYELDLSALPKGLYMAEFRNGQKFSVHKLILD